MKASHGLALFALWLVVYVQLVVGWSDMLKFCEAIYYMVKICLM